MVVNRKQPVAPQVASRSASTQNIPTKRQPPAKNALRRNGAPEIDSRPSATKTHKTTAKIPRPSLRPLALAVCGVHLLHMPPQPHILHPAPLPRHRPQPALPLPPQLSRAHPRALHPAPVKHTLALTHDLAEPYLAAAQAKADPYVAPLVKATRTVTPYVRRAADAGKALWTRALVPFYTGTLQPYYRTAVLPRWRRYVQPRLAPLAARAEHALAYYVYRPLHVQAGKLQTALHRRYHAHVQPYVAQLQPHVVRAYTAADSAARQAADAYMVHVHPRLVTAWAHARPLLCTAWKHSKAITVKAAEVTTTQLTHAARALGAHRRTYVDPHVRRIWDKVAEGTESAPLAPAPLAAALPDTKVEAPEAVAEPTDPIAEPTRAVAAEEAEETPAPPPVEVVVEEEIVEEEITLAEPAIPAPEEPAADAEPHPALLTATPAPTPAAVVLAASAALVLEEPAASLEAVVVEAPAATEVPEPEPEPEQTQAPASVAESVPETTPTQEASTEALHAAASVAAASLLGAPAGDELDLDAFLHDLGVDEPQPAAVVDTQDTPTSSTAPEAPAVSALESPTEAEKAAAIAAKRNAIVARHEKWFDQLDSLIANETEALVQDLEAWRTEKAAELGGMPLVQDVQREGERLIRGLESYLAKTSARQPQWKLPADSSAITPEEREAKKTAAQAEKEKWATVLGKVEAKFGEKVQAVQGAVHAWFSSVREKEIQDTQASATRVKNLAEQAQADLGLDYAWLEDVTYADWQSYHDLMRAFETYQDTAHALQNGTSQSPPAPADPVLPALDALHRELEDVILGFSVALAPVRSQAAKLFSVRPSAEDEEDEEESGFFVVRDGEVRKDDLRGVDLGGLGIEKKPGAGPVNRAGGEGEEKESEKEDEVRILPIESGLPAGGGGGGAGLEGGGIFVGKDRVQVEQALGGVPLEPAAARHEEL
ncbi:hypothetical protein BJ912DRAFT_1139908 [Pholiota molesta]|nr:hypothetical protein BJ912DRAFT_1139908 [Pholiota molesta]